MLHKNLFVLSCTLLSLLVGLSTLADGAEDTGRQTLSLDNGWHFYLGDIPFPVITGHGASYHNAKAGTTGGAAAPEFDDSEWRTLNLPHDWAVEGPFDEKANLSQGYRARGIGWYRRYFKVDAADRGKHLEIQFEGVSSHCTVWFNGTVVHRNWCGYTSFYIDITSLAKYGNDVNTIAVRVDADDQEGWWYEGAGIYRHTWLVKRSPVHIVTDGVYANPIKQSDNHWTIPVEVTLNSSAKDSANVIVESIVFDSSGKEIARGSLDAKIDPFNDIISKYAVNVTSPKLWSIEEPTLYDVRTSIKQEGKEIDSVTTHCGFRTIKFDPANGFFLNDQSVKIKGTCNHQDHAGVGVAVPDSIWDFRVRKLKEMGSNAFRCAHNPPCVAFLDACDRQGLLVMDENRNFNTSDEYIRQLEWLIKRDRNRPSVILWSVFNEEPMQGSEQGYDMVRRMSAVVKKYDTSRPVTAAQSNAMMLSVNASKAADVAGFNYQHKDYDDYHNQFPDKPMTSSEDTSAVMTRGEYKTDRRNSVIDAYDTQYQPWGLTHREAWKMIDQRKFVAGGFVWTGFDYRGEPQPLQWPATGSSFGIMDLCGFPKTAFYIHQATWIEDKPILQLIPHWNWQGSEGKNIKVMACSNADSVELSLNGKSLGSKPVDKYDMVSWDVPYEAGKLEAVGTKDGKKISTFTVETTDAPAAIQLIPDRQSINNDGNDAIPVTVQVVDAKGRPVPTANNMIQFQITGGGSIIGLNNGNPNCHEPEKGDRHSIFNGLAQVILQSKAGSTDKITLKATCEGMNDAIIAIELNNVPPIPEQPAYVGSFNISRWRLSPITDKRPDPNQKINKTDMNTWTNVNTGNLPVLNDGTFAIYRTTFTPRAIIRKKGGKITFHSIIGKAEIWIDGKMISTKDNPDKADLTVPLPPGNGERTISILIEAPKGTKAGLEGSVGVD